MSDLRLLSLRTVNREPCYSRCDTMTTTVRAMVELDRSLRTELQNRANEELSVVSPEFPSPEFEGERAETHKGVVTLFRLLFVKTGKR